MARRVCIKSPVNTLSGYGNDGYGLAVAFSRAGWDVHLQPTVVNVPIPAGVAGLLTKEPNPPYDLFINHIDPINIELTEGERRCANVAIAWTMWEWDRYKPKGWSRMRKQLKPFDVLVAYEPVTEQALAPFASKTLVQQGGYEPGDWPYIGGRNWGGPFKFCMVGALGPRKDPFKAVDAFDMLKEEHGDNFDAELHLKTVVSSFHPSMLETYPWLRIHCAYWSTKTLHRFYGDMHCLLAPSHGEGKNLPCLEAMSTGIPTIATGWGGHTVWQHPSYSYALDYNLVEYGQQGQWADVPVVELAEQMWYVYNNREEAREKGDLAAKTIPTMCGWDKVVDDLLRKLRDAGVTI